MLETLAEMELIDAPLRITEGQGLEILKATAALVESRIYPPMRGSARFSECPSPQLRNSG